MFTIDFVTSRTDDKPAERFEFDGRTVEGAATLADSMLHSIGTGIPRGGAPVIGYLIRDESGVVLRRL